MGGAEPSIRPAAEPSSCGAPRKSFISPFCACHLWVSLLRGKHSASCICTARAPGRAKAGATPLCIGSSVGHYALSLPAADDAPLIYDLVCAHPDLNGTR